jgi:hypothetical protein
MDRESEAMNERETFEKIKSRGMISVKALAAKPPESRNEAENNFLMLYMKLNHPTVFKDCDRETLTGLVKRLTVQVYKPGDILIRNKSICSQMMMIIEGHVVSSP